VAPIISMSSPSEGEEGTNAGGFNLCAAADGCTTQLGATADVVPSTLVGDSDGPMAGVVGTVAMLA